MSKRLRSTFRVAQVMLVCFYLFVTPLSACTPQRPRSVTTTPPAPTPSTEARNDSEGWSTNIKELVRFPSPEVEFIIGPQIKSGSSTNPAPWFDQNATTRGLALGESFPASAPQGTVVRGTVSVIQSNKNVIGAGTRFVSDFPGAANNYYVLITDAEGKVRSYYLASVQDDTHITLSAPWQQASATGRQLAKKTGDEVDAYANLNYYDHALCQYINYYRTGDARFLNYARKVADSWWKSPAVAEGTVKADETFTPRSSGLSGLMLRALDGKPEMWPWIVSYTRYVFETWVGSRITYPNLYYGVRDPGYSLLYAANLARVHPDASVRQEFRTKAVDAATKYYARLQFPDGSWRWGDEAWVGNAMQPFHVGLLLEGLIAVHRLTGDQAVRTAIIKGAEAIYERGYNANRWRGTYYQVEGNWANGTKCDKGCGAASAPFPPSDVGQIAEARQLNSTSIHALGYAYLLTKDPKFKKWGDEMFDATYGGKDGYRGLAAFRAKEYDEAYRSGGRYLAWRLAWSAPAAAGVSETSSATAETIPVSGVPSSPVFDLVSGLLNEAKVLTNGPAPSEAQIQTLLDDTENAEKAVAAESGRLANANAVLTELKAARNHLREALAIAKAQSNGGDDSKLRLGWATARLKRAVDRMQTSP